MLAFIGTHPRAAQADGIPDACQEGVAVRAAVITEFGKPIEILDVPVPVPAADEVLVRVEAAGMCATDVKLRAGLTAPPPPLPHVPGHEVAGAVVDPATLEPTGERVAGHILAACGRCAECRRGYPVFCPNALRMGLDRWGGMAEYVTIRRELALPIPDGLDAALAAAAMDSVTTPWHALHGVGRVQPGETAVIAGVGGLGMNAVQIAVAAGARVAAVDVDDERLAAAREAGAEAVFHAGDLAAIRAWADGGADLALELSGRREGFDTAAGTVRGGGRVVCCGYAPGVEYGLDSARLVLDNIQILGSRNAAVDETRAALAAVASGQVVPLVSERAPLASANTMLDRLAAGQVRGRGVLLP
jgi:D-arabinose 1-dehydrogenase-like Zn-dependent alcohol dehydrogenase